jgi:hypothetical protein
MNAEVHLTAGRAGHDECWCCGKQMPRDALVHLGHHPEVGVCINCAHFLQQRARDRQATVLRQQLRGAAESVRRQVMAHGWQSHPVAGPALKWLNRHSPW